MDKFQVIHSFWSSFGLPAYDQNTVPAGDKRPPYPYITYEAAVASLGQPIALSGSLWYYGSSWNRITGKLLEIDAEIGRALWIRKGSPFAQRMSDPNDMIRRIIINIEAEFLTA